MLFKLPRVIIYKHGTTRIYSFQVFGENVWSITRSK